MLYLVSTQLPNIASERYQEKKTRTLSVENVQGARKTSERVDSESKKQSESETDKPLLKPPRNSDFIVEKTQMDYSDPNAEPRHSEKSTLAEKRSDEVEVAMNTNTSGQSVQSKLESSSQQLTKSSEAPRRSGKAAGRSASHPSPVKKVEGRKTKTAQKEEGSNEKGKESGERRKRKRGVHGRVRSDEAENIPLKAPHRRSH
ncbi:hypothetical protein GCK32_018530 [Trichostrongylus colubriformis]|uniref:Uncharacterized protein n=1 Tax=Trichostrongylus colubriformis TaxID=6319 RepID=A0AAN8IE81_TRICO